MHIFNKKMKKRGKTMNDNVPLVNISPLLELLL
jgi:hypothetical protein